MSELGTNIFDVDWSDGDDWRKEAEDAGWGGVRGKRMTRPPGATLNAAVWELEPGAVQAPYHFHHGTEEMLVVLRGRPTLRTPEGERQLAEGEVVHFTRGADGAHQVRNATDAVVRYMIAAAVTSPDAVEYPDSGKVCVMARTPSTRGPMLYSMHRLADEVGYFDGETRGTT